MVALPNRRSRVPMAIRLTGVGLLALLCLPGSARAGKLSWLDEVVQQVVAEAKAGGRVAARGGGCRRDGRAGAGRLFVHEADEGLEILAKRSDDLARVGRRVEQPSEALLQSRFTRLLRNDPEAARTFATLAPAERRLVVEMGETAQRLARRYPGQAETMIRRLGTEGLTATRVFGDDVAEVIVKEGPESLGVLRKTGRGGWSFFTREVLPHKKKLAAAGCSPPSWPTPRSSSTTRARPPSTPSASSPRPASSSRAPSAAGRRGGSKPRSAPLLASYGLDVAVLRYAGDGPGRPGRGPGDHGDPRPADRLDVPPPDLALPRPLGTGGGPPRVA